ncbi:expressed unknown protein [Seminavis robusta]|uniref:Uncharacterized protein n=1 Tax=Seminavis robusta TaxID=568900 RepID=A0A9N8F4J5_9STRA|nr:expressed unknown protein [Seminavis robusta]|eukprot:Sro2982_g341530.1 n/a (218) ;mRNA; f:1884-2697
MGLSASRFATGGTLRGAYAPPLPGVAQPTKLDPEIKKYRLTVPQGKGAGDRMIVSIKGREVSVRIPDNFVTDGGGSRPIKPGDKFTFEWGDRDRVIASTLPTLPGSTVVEAKPILFANVSHAFFHARHNDQVEQTKMSKIVQGLMQEAQSILLQKTVEEGCNAVLSINCNVSTDSSGDNGNSKIVIVTMIGTPCVVMPLSQLPAVQAEVTVVPEMLY